MDQGSPSAGPGVPWGLFDRALAALSPASAARRYASRVAIANLRRGYEGGKAGRVTGNWSSTNASADAEIAAFSAPLRSRSHDLVRNNALAAQAVLVLVNNIVGPGIRPRAAGASIILAKTLRGLRQNSWLRSWEFDPGSLQSLADRSKF